MLTDSIHFSKIALFVPQPVEVRLLIRQLLGIIRQLSGSKSR